MQPIIALEPGQLVWAYLNDEDGEILASVDKLLTDDGGGNAAYVLTPMDQPNGYRQSIVIGVARCRPYHNPIADNPNAWLSSWAWPNADALRDNVTMMSGEHEFWTGVSLHLNYDLAEHFDRRVAVQWGFNDKQAYITWELLDGEGHVLSLETVYRAPCLGQRRGYISGDPNAVPCTPQFMAWRETYHAYVTRQLFDRFSAVVNGDKPKSVIARILAGE